MITKSYRCEQRLRTRTPSLRGALPKTLLCTGLLSAALVFAAPDAGADHSVPFKGKDTFAASPAGPPGDGKVIHTVDSGSGTAAHLGRFTMVASETVDTDSMTVSDGTFTMTAANGDTVSGTYSGTIQPGLTGYLVCGPITGGTGRFAGATGTIVFDGTFDPLTFTGSDVISGSISSVGSP